MLGSWEARKLGSWETSARSSSFFFVFFLASQLSKNPGGQTAGVVSSGLLPWLQLRLRRSFPGLNRMVFPGGISTSRPVFGLRPMPRLRSLT